MSGSYIKMQPIMANKPRFCSNLLLLNAAPCVCREYYCPLPRPDGWSVLLRPMRASWASCAACNAGAAEKEKQISNKAVRVAGSLLPVERV